MRYPAKDDKRLYARISCSSSFLKNEDEAAFQGIQQPAKATSFDVRLPLPARRVLCRNDPGPNDYETVLLDSSSPHGKDLVIVLLQSPLTSPCGRHRNQHCRIGALEMPKRTWRARPFKKRHSALNCRLAGSTKRAAVVSALGTNRALMLRI
nr:hypothetical protein BDOA9_0204220 [Bradyrhizobium sp. DOA9]